MLVSLSGLPFQKGKGSPDAQFSAGRNTPDTSKRREPEAEMPESGGPQLGPARLLLYLLFSGTCTEVSFPTHCSLFLRDSVAVVAAQLADLLRCYVAALQPLDSPLS